MRRLVRFLGTTLLGGLLVILPIYLAVLATLAIGKKLIGILAPLAKLLPEGVPHPDVVVALLTVLVCFVAGLVAAGFPRTSVGRGFEEKVLERLPGYSMLRMATRSLFGDAKAGLQIALVEMEDGLVVGVIVERHPIGWVTVFVPSTPAPASGSVYLFPETKVHAVDLPLGVGLKAASRYGRGAGALLEGLRDRSVLKAS
ncbi:MAG TPA: DUF502 domain-containing protein [Myxococcaceae bacterium]|nr:DUF502 domain-containing protein [Myxococcaceae bacterium]